MALAVCVALAASVAATSGVAVGTFVGVFVGSGVEVGVFVGKGVEVGRANPGMLLHALRSRTINKVKYGKRFMLNPPGLIVISIEIPLQAELRKSMYIIILFSPTNTINEYHQFC
jgi:hypothetical protein